MSLEREEYIEQAYFFRALSERMAQAFTAQELLAVVREELLSTAMLPIAIDFMSAELRHSGVFHTAMAKLPHYFTPFQTFVVTEAEKERGRFDLYVAAQILEREATYRAQGATPQGIFLYQFECLCRNRLGYDQGLAAIAGDPIFDAGWREWIDTVRRQIGLVDFADMLYGRSEHYVRTQARRGVSEELEKPVLFGEKEGKIAAANRRKDPLFMFAALARQLGYPSVPRPARVDETAEIVPQLVKKVDRLETRVKLLEEEQKGGIDLSKFYGKPPSADEA